MQVRFEILRSSSGQAPYLETFTIEAEAGNTILDGLNQIKWQQAGSLAFRRNCRNTICGSCAMRVNGRSVLACKENIGSELARFPTLPEGEIPKITIAPLGNMPVIRDLVVDMKSFWNNLQAVDPYVSTAARNIPEREFLQTPEQRAALEATGNCILCGACYSECNAREVNPDFVGPHALAKAARMIGDNRDDQTPSRLQAHNTATDGVWACTRCQQCDSVCPMDVAPLEKITQIKQAILNRAQEPENLPMSRSVRHRTQLIELVKQGGWLDERKFGVTVVGNSGRDLAGMASLVPLGLRLLAKGKFPLTFHPSEGTIEVRALIESVQAFEAPEAQDLAPEEHSASL